MRTRLATIVVIILLTGVGLAACTAYAQPTPKPPPKPALAVQVQTVSVTLTDTAIVTKQTTLRAEERTVFRVTNHGTVVHQFWLMPANMPQLMKQVPMSQWRTHLLYSTEDIAPGKMAEFEYTFTKAMLSHPHGWAMGNYTPSTQTLIAVPLHLSA